MIDVQHTPFTDHPGGSLNTTPPLRQTQPYPVQGELGLSLDDDTPLPGAGQCPIEGPCEGCQ